MTTPSVPGRHTPPLNISDPHTDREMHIAQVAAILAEALDDCLVLAQGLLAYAGRINRRTGWTYGASLPSQRPYIGGDWTQIEGRVLPHQDLRRAVAAAIEWVQS